MSKTVCFITRNFGKYDPDSLRGYESIGGFRALRKALTMEGYAIADVLAANGVQGRGGAAYDMGKKWRQARDVPGAHKCVVCNADEGEPGTFKDRELLTHDPFQLLEGMIIAGWAVGAGGIDLIGGSGVFGFLSSASFRAEEKTIVSPFSDSPFSTITGLGGTGVEAGS